MKLLPLSPQQVQALNRGATVVRVPVEPQPELWEAMFDDKASTKWSWKDNMRIPNEDALIRELVHHAPHQPGDTVAIGEEWRVDGLVEPASIRIEYRDETKRDIRTGYEFGLRLIFDHDNVSKWQPASTMPLEFARHFRVIGEVKAVQDDTAWQGGLDQFEPIPDDSVPIEWMWHYELTELKGTSP